jgi:hypothetical protein
VTTLIDVLGEVRRGRVAYLGLTPDQRRALRDHDDQIALDVLRHLLGARKDRRDPEDFPLTEAAFQAVARKLGYRVGQKKARRLIGRLIEAGVVIVSGSYRQAYKRSAARSGFRVRLLRLARRSGLLPSGRKASVGKRSFVNRRKRPRWWAHPLFGVAEGRPPPGIPRARLCRMRSLDERFARSG